MKVRLKQDILIPAGTIFDEAPRRIEMTRGHVEYIMGLTKDSSGTLLYFIDPDDPALREWFEVLDAAGSANPCGDTFDYFGWIRVDVLPRLKSGDSREA